MSFLKNHQSDVGNNSTRNRETHSLCKTGHLELIKTSKVFSLLVVRKGEYVETARSTERTKDTYKNTTECKHDQI